MPGVVEDESEGRKRKRSGQDGSVEVKEAKSRKAPKLKTSTDDEKSQILLLGERVTEAPKHYGNIDELQKMVAAGDKKPESAMLAAVSLCKAFCRLIASEKLAKDKGASEKEAQTVQALRTRLRNYVASLVSWIGSPHATQENTALQLLMRIVKEEASGSSKSAEQSWRNTKGTFTALLNALLQGDDAEGARQEFIDEYVEEKDDVRFYTFVAVKQCLQENGSESVANNAVDLMSKIEGIPESEDQLADWYGEAPEGKSPLLSITGHRKVAREAWLAVFRSKLTVENRKKLLTISTTQVLPWFANHLELLADFLTDSFNQAGSMALLALSGLFHLITEKNLDYPDFYTKLYSLLDEDVLHSKHRSRFFRQVEIYLNSSHLPAAMVASFIKRFSRLALQAPPGAIVWIVPWVYNQLKQHPPCTFMLHRTYHPAHTIYHAHPNFAEEGMDDPFDMKQSDPMLTGAIDSSLWELETLRAHYHPNVATLAKIIGEQFTKREYQLEDFLDHSYASLVDAELGKEMKKAPVVEWEIPKRIVTREEGGLNEVGNLLQSAMTACRS
ncbi:uncharacterized protein MYCFIDRAFT_28238 [Pseudocercospora fijiensis CIRAD86]|uniref:CCAAT-binding factor domain-containing protein n=1 Tax=Pseudocercospora fijiensis (strain CIRAD86) TaxID=383855 RepID=N1Q6L8_PSEFD|nr:uncharacterized protein MYCFIDRAFT_28238 [Pseudocercospora fijiensis CIRAD86]EME88085.1 hypothetical protein MYCFIDRAFT_28238 [Pseudocercospora fijiensis CIRAD86]